MNLRAARSLTRSVTEFRIVEAAVQLFAQQGFKGTATRKIAELAQVNEATVFRHFPRKAQLFWAAAGSRLGSLRLSRSLRSDLVSVADPKDVIPQIVAFLSEALAERPEIARLIFVAYFELPDAESRVREHLGSLFELIQGYFAKCAEKGLIAKVDPWVATMGLAGGVTAHHFAGTMLAGQAEPDKSSSINFAYTSFVLRALQAESE